MGQQQLFLTILVTILLGIMTIVAINTMQSMTDQAYEDAVRQDILTAASFAQGYYYKHVTMGGGSNSFSNIGLVHMQLDSVNENGSFVISNRSRNSFLITGTPTEGEAVLVAEIYVDRVVWQ